MTVKSLAFFLFFSCLFLANFQPGNGSPLKIGAFNIETFGTTKMSKPYIVKVLVEISQSYDVLMIQEIRGKNEKVFPDFVNQVMLASGEKWGFVNSSHLGRSSHTEQYGFMYRTDAVKVVKSYQYPYNLYERPPFVVHFQRIRPGGKVINFNYLAIHTKPAHALWAIDGLVDVYNSIPMDFGEDTILGGDFNAGCDYVHDYDWPNIRLNNDKRFKWLISNDMDTSVSDRTCPYDRIVVAGKNMIENSHPGEVYEFDQLKIKPSNQNHNIPVRKRLRPHRPKLHSSAKVHNQNCIDQNCIDQKVQLAMQELEEDFKNNPSKYPSTDPTKFENETPTSRKRQKKNEKHS